MSSGILLRSLGSIARASDSSAVGQEGIPVASLPPALGTAPATPRLARTAGAIDTSLDPRSAANIATLLPAAQRAARALLAAANDGRLGSGIVVKVIAGTRTYAEQDALYAQGRTTPGPIVTDAPAGYSNHNFGIAFDVGVFNGGVYLDESPLYAKVGALGRGPGLEWGGDWTSFTDEPHFQMPFSGSLAEARAAVARDQWAARWG